MAVDVDLMRTDGVILVERPKKVIYAAQMLAIATFLSFLADWAVGALALSTDTRSSVAVIDHKLSLFEIILRIPSIVVIAIPTLSVLMAVVSGILIALILKGTNWCRYLFLFRTVTALISFTLTISQTALGDPQRPAIYVGVTGIMVSKIFLFVGTWTLFSKESEAWFKMQRALPPTESADRVRKNLFPKE